MASQTGEDGSAVVDFVLSSFALLAIFVTAMGVITNLYLRTVLTNAATDAARVMARADVSDGCGADPGFTGDQATAAQATAVELARQSTQVLLGGRLVTQVTAHTEQANLFCTAVVRIAASLPGLPLVNHVTNFEATAHATLELQK